MQGQWAWLMPSATRWIEVHTDLTKKTKTRRFAADIDKSVLYASVHLIALWLHAADVQPDGDLSEYSDEDLADAAEYNGDPAVFAAALRRRGWLDADGHLHNWWEYHGKYLERRERNRLKLAKWRQEKRDSGQTELFEDATDEVGSADAVTGYSGHGNRPHNGYVPGVSGGGNRYVTQLPDRTGPDIESISLKQPVSLTSGLPEKRNGHVTVTAREDAGSGQTDDDAAEPAEKPIERERRATAQRLFDYYKQRIQPRARDFPRDIIARRLKKFSEDELRQGIDNFAANGWRMQHNATKGAAWFFKDDARCDEWLLMQPEPGKSAIVAPSTHGDGAANRETTVTGNHLRESAQQLEVRDLLKTVTLSASTVTVESKPAYSEPMAGVAADDSDVAF